MSNMNWFIMMCSIVTMGSLGFIVLDHVIPALIFGIGSGGLFGWVISSLGSKDSSKE